MGDVHLPQGWCISKISEISFKGEQRKPSGDKEFIYVDIGSINRDSKCIESPLKITGKNAPSRARKVINTGDVLVSLTRPNLNAVALVPKDLNDQIASTGFEVIKSVWVDSRYIFALTRSKDFIDSISGAVQGALYPAAKSSDVQAYKFSLPPLEEQKVIADKLDALLTKVEKNKARLERISELMKAFRQSVLSAAVSGKLVSVNNPITVTVGEIATDIRYGTSKKCDYNGGQTPVIRIPNISDRKLNTSDLKYADFTEKELKTLALKVGDILVIRSNGSLDLVGKPALVEQKYEGFLYAGYLIRIRCNEKKILPSFLLNIMNSRVVRDVVEISSRSTSGVNNINSKELAALKFVLPSIEEQAEIVQYVEKFFDFADSIEQKANVALERVNNLTQSIFAKAFRGELTADWRTANPDLVSGENSAESLLEKIKAERKALEAAKKTRTRKNV
ncbi:type I restriction endonuclease subunit S [Providencia rettgeri]|uniref:Type I restriction endonuclease subunit S n=1 Tax=Providencia rettgeri TaxID=587 RepID=A0AAP2NWG7_PRORE|nr:restriction endonuclease subunit S [Providencia rettgeri]MBX6951415.1 type I restriction endonuclease subunit S [Providencia rettgeri]MBX6954204.1 type I restriction endonuclease subunit S [Providencia rettgeri]MBX6960782.1 type I restriction endonuclease subunit S [Providencia rettgeri]MBX6973246.1 type I restriction endonuclease subunit S [Providencia rettgeri]MBX6981380.1 type I restriction endonuclease subunit S [Providencia rettgeri]